jgi:hypothetical protein
VFDKVAGEEREKKDMSWHIAQIIALSIAIPFLHKPMCEVMDP